MIDLGVRVKDNITGFTGISVGRATHLHGCVHISVQPETLKDGSPSKGQVFDEQRIEELEHTKYFKKSTEPSIQPGSKVRDTFTKFEGTLHIYNQHLFSVDDVYIIPPTLKDGVPSDGAWIHLSSVELITDTPPPVSEKSSAKTGSVVGVPAREYPTR